MTGRLRNARGIEVAPIAVDQIDAHESLRSELLRVAEGELADGGRGERAVEVCRVAGYRAQSVRAKQRRIVESRTERAKHGANRVRQGNGQALVVDRGTLVREIDRQRVARNLIR